MWPLKHEVGCGRSTHIPIHMHSHHSKGSNTANLAVPSLVPVLPCMNHRLLFLHLFSLSAAPNVPFIFFILCSTQTNTGLARVKSASYRKSNLGVRRCNSCLAPWVSQQRLQNLFLLKNKGTLLRKVYLLTLFRILWVTPSTVVLCPRSLFSRYCLS